MHLLEKNKIICTYDNLYSQKVENLRELKLTHNDKNDKFLQMSILENLTENNLYATTKNIIRLSIDTKSVDIFND